MSAATDIFHSMATTLTHPLALDALIALRDPKLDAMLAQNPNLSLAQRALLHKTATVNTAANLANSAIGDDQIRPLLKDPRERVRYALFVRGFPGASDQFLEELTNSWLSRSEANFWLESRTRKPPKHLIQKVARYAFYQSSFDPMADPEIFTLEEAQDLLSRIATKSGESRLCALTDRRPELIPYIVGMVNGTQLHNSDNISTAFLLTALTTSRHIFDQELLASFVDSIKALRSPKDKLRLYRLLGTNPNLSTENTAAIIKIVKRSKSKAAAADLPLLEAAYNHKSEVGHLTSDWAELQGSPEFDKAVSMIGDRYRTTANGPYPTLAKIVPVAPRTPENQRVATGHEPVDLTKRYLAFNNLNTSDHYKLRDTTLNNQVAPLINPLGKPGWDLFTSLALSWQASVAELIDATITTLS